MCAATTAGRCSKPPTTWQSRQPPTLSLACGGPCGSAPTCSFSRATSSMRARRRTTSSSARSSSARCRVSRSFPCWATTTTRPSSTGVGAARTERAASTTWPRSAATDSSSSTRPPRARPTGPSTRTRRRGCSTSSRPPRKTGRSYWATTRFAPSRRGLPATSPRASSTGSVAPTSSPTSAVTPTTSRPGAWAGSCRSRASRLTTASRPSSRALRLSGPRRAHSTRVGSRGATSRRTPTSSSRSTR